MKTILVLYLNESLNKPTKDSVIENFESLASKLNVEKLILPINSETRLEIYNVLDHNNEIEK